MEMTPYIVYIKFQFTPLCEGRHDMTTLQIQALLFQFTPLCEGRHSAE